MVQEIEESLLSPVMVDMAGTRGRVTARENTLMFTEMVEGGESPGPRYQLEHKIKGFDCLVTEPGRLYGVMVDEQETLSGTVFSKDSLNKLFEPYKAAGAIRSLSLAAGINNDVNLFFSVEGYKGTKLFHCRTEQGTLKQISVLEEGDTGDFRALRSTSDLWGSFNLFYQDRVKGISVLKHQFYVPFSKTWSKPLTLYGPDQGEVENYSFFIDADNNIYLALTLKAGKRWEVVHLKREMGGWPRGGWQRPLLIDQEEKAGVPVIEFFRKGYLQIFYFAGKESKLYVWRDGEVKSLQRKALEAVDRALVRSRSTSPTRAEYLLVTADGEMGEQPVGYCLPKEVARILPSVEEEELEVAPQPAPEMVEEEGEENGEDVEEKPRDERDLFVRQAIQIMQAKTDLETSLRKKDKELHRQKNTYENKTKLLRDQLSTKGEAYKSLEAKLSHQEASVMGLRAEQKSWEKEVGHLKKQNWELREDLKEREREVRELSVKVDHLKDKAADLESQVAESQGFMGKLGRIFKRE